MRGVAEQTILEIQSQVLEGLTSARELALLRHSLSDELASLRDALISTSRSNEVGPTILEEIELLHRSLKEFENVKSYVLVIEEALKLRYLFVAFDYM